ncbi:hypothetical protein ACU4GD_22990 [Cupriavidus basilensis]
MALLAGCTGPVEFSAGGPDTVSPANPDSLDFGPMDRSIAQCKASVSQQARHGAVRQGAGL